jgi:hypothetical protein
MTANVCNPRTFCYMTMRYYILTLFTIFSALPMSAQDTCRVFTIPNPHGAAMTISRVFIADTVNFSVEPLQPVPFNIGASETWDARVCIKARDGQSHSTTIRYQTTHGQASYAVTMNAPGTAGIVDPGLPNLAVTFPQPTSGRVTVRVVDHGVGELRAHVFDHSGGLMPSIPVMIGSGGDVSLDLEALPSGSYLVVLDVEGQIVARSSVVVVH